MSSPVGELLKDKNYRGFLLAQTFIAGINGTSRFTFVWLVVTLTDWTAAEGLVAVCLGLPLIGCAGGEIAVRAGNAVGVNEQRPKDLVKDVDATYSDSSQGVAVVGLI